MSLIMLYLISYILKIIMIFFGVLLATNFIIIAINKYFEKNINIGNIFLQFPIIIVAYILDVLCNLIIQLITK
jgi:lipopolysaccharide export LptBFGC system permease protein LptF